MATLSSGDIISVIWDTTLYGQQCLLTTHWKHQQVTGTDPDTNDAYTAVLTYFESLGEIHNQLVDIWTTNITGIKIRFQTIYPIRYAADVRTPTISSGQIDEAAAPSNISAAITLKGELAGARYRGTKHMFGFSQGYWEGDDIKPTSIDILQDLGDALIGDTDNIVVGGATFKWIPVIYHREAPGLSTTPIKAEVNPYVRVQRRRTARLGS